MSTTAAPVAEDGELAEILNPATEEVVATVAFASVHDTDAAIARAAAAYPAWRAVSPSDRARLLRRFAQAVDGHIEELARLEVRNAGHTIGNARWEAGNVRDVLDYYSATPERLTGIQIPVPGGVNITFREPIGVVGIIVPWNFPLPIAAWGLGPALASGNTVVLKPAELTPLTAIRLGELAREAGLPDGVLEVVPGRGPVVGWRLVTHPAVRKVCFTGSSAVGRRIMAGCAEQIKRFTLELGGKSANIVFADADLPRAAASAPMAVFDNAGQDCCARSRLLVERRIVDDFLALMAPAVEAVRVGDPGDETTQMGPLISATQRDRVDAFVPDDAPVVIRGRCPEGPGFWFAPTVLLPASPDDPTLQEEIFGPVVSVVPFDDEDHAVQLANDSRYGLSGSIWTENLGRALRVGRAVEAGNLSVNSHSSVRYWTPFGGFKQSGIGRELGPDAPDGFTEVKNLFISTDRTTS
jgi:acyl-CoA reductase-like NAD-dependent aldehyde dehydrogenase